MEKKKLLLAARLTDECLKEVEKYCDVETKVCPEDGGLRAFDDNMIEEYANHEIIVFSLQDVTDKCLKRWVETGLKLLVCTRGTPVNCPWKTIHEIGIPLVYSPGRNAQAVAEMVFGLILGLTRNIAYSSHKIRTLDFCGSAQDIYEIPDRKDINWLDRNGERIYNFLPMNYELDKRTIGIVGFGAIGRKVCKIAKYGFDMKVLAYDPYMNDEAIESAGAKPVSLDELLKESDFVSIHLPVTPETRDSVNMEWFKKMKPTAFFINTARAAVVNQKDIIEAIENKIIAGYASDVCWVEPIPENHPFVDRTDVLLTPHIGAQVSDIARHQSEIITEDIISYCENKELKNIWKRIE